MDFLTKTTISLSALALLCGCAGSAPDFAQRTTDGASQEAKLANLFAQPLASGAPVKRLLKIDVPVCSSTAGEPAGGWSIDAGEWCVVPCDQGATTQSRWVTGQSGNRCLATPVSTPATRVTVDFDWSDLSLSEQTLFDGLSRSFLSDTEWKCEAFTYLIDPDTGKGFWSASEDGNRIYRFFRNGRLLTGQSLEKMRVSGSWSVNAEEQVFFNSREVFSHAIDYGGGRFDSFESATAKQVCRYVREAEPPQ